jgi:flagellar basal body rod protein FlgG
MIRALYTAASGLETGLHMQESVADNLANATTTGYKGERAASSEFAGVLARSIGPAAVPVPLVVERVLGRVGTGSYVDKQSVTLDQGTQDSTGRSLDMMIQGSGFFVVQGAGGTPYYTRDGHFMRSRQDQLVTTGGAAVLDQNGAPITVTSDDIRVDSSGQVFQRVPNQVTNPDGSVTTQFTETPLGTLQVVTADPAALVPAGQSQFTLVPSASVVPAQLGGSTLLVQGSLEQSNVDVAASSTRLMSLANDYNASQHVFTTINDTLNTAVTQIGRVGNG